ncbi:hypothetical protein O6P43_026993 [Quillaja saponaria]|uniref:Uncharacterized protein n=1 Tax=Quillaja saponaria TaxID=32244 RepID=A0AAD7L3D2_QUISA|nr:hypothetical protein O6P43_026993 [Quillaja saponaria]
MAARSGKLFAPKKPLAQTIVHSPSSLHRIAMEGFDLVDKCYGDSSSNHGHEKKQAYIVPRGSQAGSQYQQTAEFGEQFAAKNYAGRMCTDPPFRPWI